MSSRSEDHPTLHLLSGRSDPSALCNCLQTASPDDVLIFAGLGTLCLWQHETVQTLAAMPRQMRICVLRTDLPDQALPDALVPRLELIDDRTWVELTIHCGRSVSWS